jgi:hypothetical protein
MPMRLVDDNDDDDDDDAGVDVDMEEEEDDGVVVKRVFSTGAANGTLSEGTVVDLDLLREEEG